MVEYVKTTMIDTLLNAFAPHRCSSCGEIGSIFCESCKYDTISDSFPGCVICAKPCGLRGVCSQCARKVPITQAWCVGERVDGLKALIDAYKFRSSRAADRACADLLDRVISHVPPDSAVVGIPTAPNTVRVRGFDHMGRVADALAKKRGLDISYPLERAATETLHFLPKAERVRLGPSLFRLSGKAVPEKILLLDDIVTTGTTIVAATRLLKQAGAKEVYVAVLARQPEQ